ncbi:uncharacterized protein LOC114711758 [Neltuma alba]|uniref:uncharacterized protein LOC114711758 n=1 Tax=Neltuma alba TaxID=207710 RepID=UPI0010A50F66|nr:uncharacterized protein LOC114711758 [Prosopis alba]
MLRSTSVTVHCRQSGTDLMKKFKDVLASGDSMYALSASQSQSAPVPKADTKAEEDIYRIGLDQEEGLGDSEDKNFGINLIASIGVTGDLAGCDLNNPTSSGLGDPGSDKKRKRCETSNVNKKKKVATSTKIVDSLSVIVAASKQRAATLNDDPHAFNKVLAHLADLKELNDDGQLYYACAKMLTRLRWARQVYLTLVHNKRKLLRWLIPAAQDPDIWKGFIV